MTVLKAAAAVILLFTLYTFVFERFFIRVNHYRIRVPNLPEAFSGFRIVHLTDLHYGFLQPLATLRYAVWRANRIRRDITVCTGDYVLEKNGHRKVDRAWQVLAGLYAPEGVYSVLGNHDHWADTGRSIHWMEKLRQNLRGRKVFFEREGRKLWVAGAGDLWEDHINLDTLLSDVPDTDCRIVLAHNPDTADTEFNSRIDLMLAGHTHGGQFVLPFLGPPYNPVVNKEYTSGLRRSGKGEKVFISKGVGWGTFPARLNCFPEIAVLELLPRDQAQAGSTD